MTSTTTSSSILILTSKDISTLLRSPQTIQKALESQSLVFKAYSRSHDDSSNAISTSAPPIQAPLRTTLTSAAVTSLIMPARASTQLQLGGIGVKVVSVPNEGGEGGLPATTTVFDEVTGKLRAVINARELTALRNACGTSISQVPFILSVLHIRADFCQFSIAAHLPLGSVLYLQTIYPQTTSPPTSLLLFGSGAQIQSHAHLITQTFPSIRRVTIIARSRSARLDKLESKLKGLWQVREQGVELTIRVNGERGWDVENEVSGAEVIVTATPSTTPLFPAGAINTSTSSDETEPLKPKTIILIGSYKPHMLEIPPSIITDLVATGGKVTVDSREACLAEAGELQGLEEGDVVELGELLGPEDVEVQGVERLKSVRNGRVRVFKSVSLGVFRSVNLTKARLFH